MKLCNKLNLDGIHDSRFHPDRADPWVTARSNYLLKARQRCVVGLAALLVIPALAQPTITVEPRGQFVWEGMTVSLNVSVRGTAPVSLQWQYDGESIPDATNRTLNLARLTTARSFSPRAMRAFRRSSASGSLLDMPLNGHAAGATAV